MSARLITILGLVLAAAILAMSFLYARRRGMSTTTMLTILVAVFGSLLLVLILGLLGVLSYPSLGGIALPS